MNIDYTGRKATHLTDDQQTDTANGQLTVIIPLDLFFIIRYLVFSFLFFKGRHMRQTNLPLVYHLDQVYSIEFE